MNETGRLGLNTYQEQSAQTDRFSEKGIRLLVLGMVGEIGSLLSEAKKKQRDAAAYVNYEEAVLEELGDTLWYLATIARRINVQLASLIELNGRQSDSSTGDISFVSLQPQHVLKLNTPVAQFEKTLLGLAAEAGLLARLAADELTADSNQELAARLRAILELLVVTADEASVTLETAAIQNLKKSADRWPPQRRHHPLFDDEYPDEEQLPRILQIDIYERTAKNGKSYVLQRCSGLLIGDRLTDNIMLEDDYRFHDVFHYAYAAVLGWSPVTRSLFRRKRKSEARVDEGEDGARATLIEEGMAAYVFGVAKEFDFFEKQTPGELSFTFLKNVRQFVKGYEVDKLPLWQLEEAILQGNHAFRFLRERRRGILKVDLTTRSMSIEELP